MNDRIRVNGRFRDGSQVKYFDRGVLSWATKDTYDVYDFIKEMPKEPVGLVEAFIEQFIDIKI